MPASGTHALETRTPAAAERVGAEFFYRSHVRSLSGDREARGLTRVARFGAVTVGDVLFHSDIAMACGELETAYHVNIPLRGALSSRHGGAKVLATPRVAAVYAPAGETVLERWPAGARIVCLKLDRRAVDQRLATLLGRAVDGPVAVAPTMWLGDGAGRSFARVARLVASELRNDGGLAGHRLGAAALSDCLVDAFLMAAGHSRRQELDADASADVPRAIRLAVELIEAAPDQPLTTAQLARRVHLSVRSLQRGFAEHLETTPMGYLRDVRLQRASDVLRRATPEETRVATVAAAWGFTHLGRFAAAYRDRFGESPSSTLRGHS
jgi:AraC-like DNA-binding protein